MGSLELGHKYVLSVGLYKQPVVSQGLLVKTFIESVLWLGKCTSLLMSCQQVLYLFINHLMSVHLTIHHLFSVKYESLHSPKTHGV